MPMAMPSRAGPTTATSPTTGPWPRWATSRRRCAAAPCACRATWPARSTAARRCAVSRRRTARWVSEKCGVGNFSSLLADEMKRRRRWSDADADQYADADPQTLINVEPGLFECLAWYKDDFPVFLTLDEAHAHGYGVNRDYKPVVVALDELRRAAASENIAAYYKRS